MNELVKELFVQADGYYNPGDQHNWPAYTITDIEKFAELLIRDSLVEIETIVKDNLRNIHWTIPEEQLCHKIMYLIRTRYGIERK